ncbi:MAG: anthranilate phosphoribosyltransferase [Candidatus Hydrogenedentes bacterium]|nr:anthranilate phosphoribosyltransferase [Candidatus Hydrogenedentota bacterium]
MTIPEAVSAVVEGRDLSREEAAEVMRHLMQGEGTPAQIGALLVGLRMKGETVEEITGLAMTMREMSTKVKTKRSPLVDTCGTGGDTCGTFNISTTAAFVAAGAGVAVAKHGNRSAASECGSADVLEALGVNIDAPPELVGECIDDIGIGFLFARSLHGAMKHVAQARTELGLRTVFNLLGPLTNPAGACGQVVGVYDRVRIRDLAQVLADTGTRHALVVTGSDGMDEITLSGPTHVAETTGGRVHVYDVSPETFGVAEAPSDTLRGGDAAENAEILKAVLDGEEGPRRDVVLINAAAAILVGDAAPDWTAAMGKARQSIDSGGARAKLDGLVLRSKAEG